MRHKIALIALPGKSISARLRFPQPRGADKEIIEQADEVAVFVEVGAPLHDNGRKAT